MRTFFALLLLSTPAFAESCPASQDYSDELSALIEDIRAAPDARTAEPISGAMWEIWLRAPDAPAQDILDKGMRQRNNFDFVGAFSSFEQLIAYCPDYAEGYNQRAFTRFLREDFEGALSDLDMTLRLSPDHVGAQSGRALTLMNMGRLGEARLQMLAALENNPWLSEGALLAKGAPLGPIGEDI